MCPAVCPQTQLLYYLADDVKSTSSTADSSCPDLVDYSASLGGGKLILNNCVDVHVGPKYEHNGNIVVHQTISRSESDACAECDDEGKSCPYCLQRQLTCCNLQCKALTLVFYTVSALFVTAVLILLLVNTKSKEPNIAQENVRTTPVSDKINREYPLSEKFVWRDTWGAARSQSPGRLHHLPVGRVILAHTVSVGTCNQFSACTRQVLQTQEMHMDEQHDFGDIGYSFMIGGDGYIYVGVGWDREGAHTYGYNLDSLGIGLIGDFRADQPNDLMIASLNRLLEFGVKIKKLQETYQIYGHCQVLPKSFPYSPGKHIMAIVKTLPNWNSTNVDKCK